MINFMVDLDALAEIAGTYDGLNKSFSNSLYVDGMANAAHDDASREFDLTAAASAGAGYLTHMYEYGVQGITKGTGRFSDPTSPAARLWVHNLTGRGGAYDVNFTFRPATQENPRPSTGGTGVPSKYIRYISRRKYVFRNKAMVMETGQEVSIRPKRGSLLFVPFYGDPGPRGTGYMMWNADTLGPINVQPGRTTTGTFTAFWENWWRTAGIKSINSYIAEAVSIDTGLALKAAQGRSAKLSPKPVASGAAALAATRKSAQEVTNNMLTRNAMARRGTKRR